MLVLQLTSRLAFVGVLRSSLRNSIQTTLVLSVVHQKFFSMVALCEQQSYVWHSRILSRREDDDVLLLSLSPCMVSSVLCFGCTIVTSWHDNRLYEHIQHHITPVHSEERRLLAKSDETLFYKFSISYLQT